MPNLIPESLTLLITQFNKLPGIGRRSAERLAYAFLDWPEEERLNFAKVVLEAPQHLHACDVCHSLKDNQSPCAYCDTARRETGTLCIVASWKDVFAIEATHEYHGLYHVLKGTLSPLEGRGPEQLTIESLLRRARELPLKEVIIALDSTVEGDATSLYVTEQLQALSINVSRLAFGLPMGSSLDYVDGGTLTQAFVGRARI